MATATTANRAIKAKPKASPDKIQADVINAQAIVDQEIVENKLHHLAESEELELNKLPEGDISVPLSFWLEHRADLLSREGLVAVQIAADEDAADIADSLKDIAMIVLPMVAQVDGRSYSIAYLLRERYNYQGQIRAIGYVRLDQLGFLSRVGCNAFELHEGDNYQAALQAFTEFSDVYQPSADSGRLIFARRRTTH